MIMEQAVQKLAAICFILVGSSHIVRPRVWSQFFIHMSNKGEAASFLNALLTLPLGVLIVAFHNVWTGAVPLTLTLIGWAYIVKSFIYFTFPKYGLRMLSGVTIEKSWMFVPPGVLMAVYGALLLYTSLMN